MSNKCDFIIAQLINTVFYFNVVFETIKVIGFFIFFFKTIFLNKSF